MPDLLPVQVVPQSHSSSKVGSVFQAALIFGTFMSTHAAMVTMAGKESF